MSINYKFKNDKIITQSSPGTKQNLFSYGAKKKKLSKLFCFKLLRLTIKIFLSDI